MVANGSEVSVLYEAAERLGAEKNLKVRVVSAISEGLLREQEDVYTQALLPYGAPIMGLTAGSSAALEGLVGPLGKVLGLPRFGASAPYKVLDEKFGYTTERVVESALTYLGEYRQHLDEIAARAR